VTVWSQQQDKALQLASRWIKAVARRQASSEYVPQVFYLAGYAGTGKTTLAKELAAAVNGEVAFAAFTGKAALVLRAKGCTDASTIHSLIYQCHGGPVPWFELLPPGSLDQYRLIIIDECSMVSAELGEDLLSFGRPVLVLGDPAQLPPVIGAGYFTANEPDALLTEVHRQALNDPIVRLSMQVREGKIPTVGHYGSVDVVTRRDFDPARALQTDQVLVGYNRTRRAFNKWFRQQRRLPGAMPVRNDKLVCLRNNHDLNLLNGSLWTVLDTEQPNGVLYLRISSDDPLNRINLDVMVWPECFAGGLDQLDWRERSECDEFDWGYCLTVHKAQGSQWNDVVLFDQSHQFHEPHRWLYTGITRAAKRLTVVL
jgi:exodeoxyribonuclease-5